MKGRKLGIGLLAGATVLAAMATTWGGGAERVRHALAGLAVATQGQASAPASASATALPANAKVAFGAWTHVGPDNLAGAAQDLVVDSATGYLYALSREGWVFRSTDGAGTWIAIKRFNTGRPLTRLAIQRDGSGVTAYLAVSEKDYQSKSYLLRMTPDGTTSDLALNATLVRTAGTGIYAIDPQGVWFSDDNGGYWNHVVAGNSQVTPYCRDIAVAGNNVFAMCDMYDSGAMNYSRDIYRSVNGGQLTKVWSMPAALMNTGWVSEGGHLAASRSNPNVVYASYIRGNQDRGAYIFRTTDGGTSWQQRTDPTGANPFNDSLLTDFDQRCANGGYGRASSDHVLVVDPTNSDIVWIGAIELYRSNDGGLNFGRASLDASKGEGAYYLPKDIRALRFSNAFNGGSNRSLYVAAQDGIYGSTDARAAVQAAPADMCTTPATVPAMTFTRRSKGYTTTAFAAADITPDGEVLATLGSGDGDPQWDEYYQTPSTGLFHGDLADTGSWVRLSYVRPRQVALDPVVGVDRFYTSRCPGALYCRWDWSSSLQRWNVTAKQQDSYPYPNDFGVSFTADPSNRSRFWGLNLSRSTNAMSTWVSAGTSPNPPQIAAGAVSPANPNLVLFAGSNGLLYRRTDALTADSTTVWVASGPFPYSWTATGVQFDPVDPNRVYAIGRPEFGTQESGVFASKDAGQTWERADQPGWEDGLPDGWMRSLVTDADSREVLYVAGDGSLQGQAGLFVTWGYKNTNGPAWHAVPTPFEGTSITKLLMRKRNDGRSMLYAFTAGRGIWAAQVTVQRFDDVPMNYWAFDNIERLARAGVTGGCATSPLRYCPGKQVLREEMAVFLLRAKYGKAYQPPTASGDFSDVPVNYWAAAWIEQLREEGITGGCATNPLKYCPTKSVLREEIAVFLLRAKHGAGYQPPPATGMYADVPTSYWAAAWIEQLSREGIGGGCSTTPKNYCPTTPVTRDQMAVFLVRAFGL